MYGQFLVTAIIQARMKSTRLFGKTMFPLAGKPVLQHIIERLRMSKFIDNIIVACTHGDKEIFELCDQLKCKYAAFDIDENDVLERVLRTAKIVKTDMIVEITSDCPCIDKYAVDDVISSLGNQPVNDYCSNVIQRTYPRGMDVQAFWLKTLEKVAAEVDNPVDRQHVSTWIYKNPRNYKRFKNMCVVLDKNPQVNYSHLRLCIDTKDDYELLKFLFEAHKGVYFGLKEVIEFFMTYPELPSINKNVEQKDYYHELRCAYGEV
jgi:spore coat polysaccharide biosynthesis protein SpsF